MKNCGKSSGKCLKFVSKSGKDLSWMGMVKKQCEVCELFNVKNRGKRTRLQKAETGMGAVFHKEKLENRMWVEETGNDGFYAEYCQPIINEWG